MQYLRFMRFVFLWLYMVEETRELSINCWLLDGQLLSCHMLIPGIETSALANKDFIHALWMLCIVLGAISFTGSDTVSVLMSVIDLIVFLCRTRVFQLLAHLSRRLTRWAYSIPMVRRPSVVVRRRPSSSVVVHTFKLEYLWSQVANLDQILCVASLGWGKGCIRFWGRLDQNSGFHGNRKPPLTYNGENDVSTFSRLFLIQSFLYLQVTRTCIKSRTSSNFSQIGPLTTELAALEHLKIFP